MDKRIFREDMSTKTLTLMSVYFLHPFVTIWGFSTAKLHMEHVYVLLLYLAIILSLLLPTILLCRMIFENIKDCGIFSIVGFVDNTDNIGIPLGITLFGEQSVIFINIANVFMVYIIGAYIYSRGSFNIEASLLDIVKIPIIQASIADIFININNIQLTPQAEEFFKMGAYASIVLQLFLLGTFPHQRAASQTFCRHDHQEIRTRTGSHGTHTLTYGSVAFLSRVSFSWK